MNRYSKFIENESFLDWVYNPTPESTRFWKNYIRENPEEKETIDVLKDILISVKTNEARLSEEEKAEIFTKLFSKIKDTKSGRVYHLVSKSYKYVAVLILLLVVTMVFTNGNFRNTRDGFFDGENDMVLDSISKRSTQLVLETGNTLLIEEEESLIEYTSLGNLVVNEVDTILVNNKKEGKNLLFNKIIVPFGKRSKIILSDGSMVHLNAGTTFVFPKDFSSKQRTVFLSGEAFFEVATNKKKPFIVKMIEEKLSVEVLGTKFNVSAYPIDSNVLTVLTEGKVAISEQNLFGARKTMLQPGQLASWSKEEENMDIKQVNTYNHTSWVQGLLYFESESIVNVVRKIERYYNVNIIFAPKLNEKQINVSGKLDLNDDIERTLENLTITTEFKFEIINDNKYMIK